jgi:hypothetical protein
MPRRIRRLVLTTLAALAGWVVGWLAGAMGHLIPDPGKYPFLAESRFLPHHVSRFAGGVSFRFAMANDVIHERFSRHGAAYYRERNRLTKKNLEALAAADPRRFPLLDDLGAGLERLGRSDEAVTVMREKLARQQASGLRGRELYTSYANLGTFLIHGSFKGAMAGERAAKERFREGIALVRQSVVVNPEAHFGREAWQAAIAEFLLASMEKPSLLSTFDCLGNRLDLPIEEILNRETNWISTGYGRPTDAAFSQGKADNEVPEFFLNQSLDDPARWVAVSPIRQHITKVGAERGWEDVAVPSHRTPVPFDEPVLGIIGMWRQGGGANPHFALALGETMLRVGQRYIAWSAFERASRMADRFSADPSVQDFLRQHCRKRQQQIEETLVFADPGSPHTTPWQNVSPPLPKEAIPGLLPSFEKELALGQGFQKEYQNYEAERIKAGVSIEDEHFYDPFSKGRKPIASSSGLEELFARVPRARMNEYLASRRRAWGIFGAGLAALAAAAFLSRRVRQK